MNTALKKFLALHHHLSLPGIGNLTIKETPALLDFTNRTITAPVSTIIFNDDKLSADKSFFHFLAQEMNVDEVQAIRSFTGLTAQLQHDMNDGKQVELNGFGNLYKQSNGSVHFDAEAMPVYLPTLTAERVIRKNATHTVMVGEDEKTSHEMQAALQEEAITEVDRWWIPAVVLGLIGIAALIYYYNVLHHTFFK